MNTYIKGAILAKSELKQKKKGKKGKLQRCSDGGRDSGTLRRKISQGRAKESQRRKGRSWGRRWAKEEDSARAEGSRWTRNAKEKEVRQSNRSPVEENG